MTGQTVPCPDRTMTLHAFADGELDAIGTVALEDHLRTCPGCRAELARIEELRGMLGNPTLRHEVPAGLRQRVFAVTGAAARPPESRASHPIAPWLGGGAIGALAASFALLLVVPTATTPTLADEVVSGQIRSLQTGHLVDVATSDRHTVKPWFNGRIDYSPPVVDLAPQGFPLVGGRLDVLEGRTVATLVFKRRLHTINVFIRPGWASARDASLTRQGYAIERWNADGLEYWAVSDIPASELATFRQVFTAESRR